MKVILIIAFFLSFESFAKGGTPMVSADEVIKKFDLKHLPNEGGYYRETYRCSEHCTREEDNFTTATKRSMSTAIYYMVTPDNFSALHRIKSDEIFHFYSGDPVEMIQIDERGNLTKYVLGPNFEDGEVPQVTVSKGIWQALRLKSGGKWGLMGTTVAPGFEFQDLEVGERKEMMRLFPEHSDEIKKFTR